MESSDLEKYGGYNAQFLHELLDDYECPVCSMALREPVLTLCGHRLCFSCSEEIKKRNYGVLVCPLDKTILNSEKVFPDKFTERAILQLKVKCDNFLKSCQWTGELKTINNHLTSCEYQEVKCLNEQCTATLLRKELSDHMEKHCIYRLVTCRYCKQKIICSENQMSSHITDSCANTIIPCQYLNIGCKFKETFVDFVPFFMQASDIPDLLESTIYLITPEDLRALAVTTYAIALPHLSFSRDETEIRELIETNCHSRNHRRGQHSLCRDCHRTWNQFGNDARCREIICEKFQTVCAKAKKIINK
ncbi:TNF receptor-associated factor 6-A isoform X6 [Hydra vulgaris]|uniref:TNF receptor-associated factor 6-A isoform X6 n=1 Tax=Hydra vulgaris TaxID=6087 RepID=UPI001F5F30C6|nr:TNF receptor-associated factor 6-A-like isoform X6 [Hydra vulgaris]